MTNQVLQNSGVVSDIAELVPYVGMTGLYTLKAPYTNLITNTVEYTCIAVINISGAIANGEDPLNEIYLFNGDTQVNFDIDEAANHCIVTLQSGLGDLVRVPNSALISLPNSDGIKYLNIILGIALSVLPENTDLTAIKTEISDLVFNTLGVRSTVFGTTVGGNTVVSHATHASIENSRQLNITSKLSARTRNQQLIAQNTALLAKVAVLENYIKINLPP
jgi:hypothetical protein